jgi:HSP20 family protein
MIRAAVPHTPLPQDASDLAADARRLLLDLDARLPGASGATGECRPALDVVETTGAIEVIADVPGVPPDALRVSIRRNTVLVVGVKLPSATSATARFHMAERSFGRFARAVRVGGAVDTSRARAVVSGGQLRVVLPRITERRGRAVDVKVERG